MGNDAVEKCRVRKRQKRLRRHVARTAIAGLVGALALTIVPDAAAQVPGRGGDQGGGLGQMPEAPPLPVDESRPKTGEAVEGEIVFDFKETALAEIVKSLGAQTGKNFEFVPQDLQQSVTVITHSPIPADLAMQILESILGTNNLTIIRALDGNLYKIVKTGTSGPEIGGEKVPMIIGPEAERPVDSDSYATHIIPVNYADATELAEILRPLGSNNAQVDVYGPTNTLVLSDTGAGLDRMIKFLREVDIPGYELEMEIFQLEYTRAEVLATQIQDVLLGPEGQAGGAAAARQANQPSPPVGRRALPGQPRPNVVIGALEETLRIVFDERLNALIVVANDSMMERVRDLIQRLDQPTPFEANNIHVYELLNADAEIVAEALNNMFSGTTPRAGSGGGGGAPGAGGGGGAATPEVQPFEKTVQITAYEQTNALMVLASPQDYKLVRETIARLDVPQGQVHVTAVIMDVRIDDSATLSVETAALDENHFFGLSNTVQLANALVQGPLSLAGPGGVVGYVDGTTEIPVPDGAGGITTNTVPNIPLLIDLLERLTNVDILSKPSLTSVDNEEANIIVGQEVPFITGSSRSLDQPATGASVFSRVEREDVGIKLKVTPQISEGDYVSMELEVEVSQTTESDIGADVNVVGPTLQKSNVTGKVVIKDGSTGIFGGLISENKTKNVSQTPILGDLPLLGWLFRSKSNGLNKRNLVVLVTPNIVKDEIDLTRMTDYRVIEFNEANVDYLFQQGFIQKLTKKHHRRNKYSPSLQSSEEYLSGAGTFKRGDIER